MRYIVDAVSIPVIGDGDTGWGNAINIKRTVKGYAATGFACVMLEDQLAPKRCGHTEGKQVVSWAEANTRFRAAVDAREEVRAAGGIFSLWLGLMPTLHKALKRPWAGAVNSEVSVSI